jgi:predicted deacylase
MSHEPVSHETTDRRVATRPSGGPVTVTVHRYRGGPGPTVYVGAAQHGIELNGTAALRRVHERLVDADVAGTVVAVPVTNPLAFDHRSYTAPPSFDALNPNLNRIWPGDDDGTFQERIAARLWPLVEDADAVVDLHTGTPDMLTHVRCGADDRTARRLAAAFGTRVVLVDGDAPDPDAGGRLRRVAAARSVPALTVELGNSRTVGRTAVEDGADGVLNVLRELDVLAADPADPPDQSVFRVDADPVRAEASGLFELGPGVGVGDRVTAGDELGVVYSPSTFEPRQRVTADVGGLVYALARGGVTVAGERLAAVAPPD